MEGKGTLRWCQTRLVNSRANPTRSAGKGKGEGYRSQRGYPSKPRRVVRPPGITGCKAARGAHSCVAWRATGDVVGTKPQSQEWLNSREVKGDPSTLGLAVSSKVVLYCSKTTIRLSNLALPKLMVKNSQSFRLKHPEIPSHHYSIQLQMWAAFGQSSIIKHVLNVGR